MSLATRLDWCLDEARDWMAEGPEGNEPETADGVGGGGASGGSGGTTAGSAGGNEGDSRGRGPRGTGAGAGTGDEGGGASPPRRRRRWILKPSTLNKGVELSLVRDFAGLREAVHDSPDIREWVLQEYVERPLLVEGRKFHLRVYALAGKPPLLAWPPEREPFGRAELAVSSLLFLSCVPGGSWRARRRRRGAVLALRAVSIFDLVAVDWSRWTRVGTAPGEEGKRFPRGRDEERRKRTEIYDFNPPGATVQREVYMCSVL